MKTRDSFSARTKEESINRTNLSLAATTLVKSALLSGALLAFAPGVACAEQMAKKGTTPYVTHFIFRPLMSIDIPGLGTATNLEAVGTTQNMKGEKMLEPRRASLATVSPSSRAVVLTEMYCAASSGMAHQVIRCGTEDQK